MKKVSPLQLSLFPSESKSVSYPVVEGYLSNHILLPIDPLPIKLREKFKKDFTLPNPAFKKAVKYGKGYVSPGIPKVIRIYSMDNEYLGLPRSTRQGYLHKQFATYGLQLELKDKRPRFQKIKLKRRDTLQPLFYQKDAIKKIVEGNVVLEFSCGKGKTFLTLLAVDKIRYKTLVLVRTNIILSQWVEAIQKIFDIKEEDIGIINGDIKREGLITIATEQSLVYMPRTEKRKIGETYGHVIFDECFVSGTQVLTEEGWKGIERIVKKKYSGKVWSLNSLGKMELKRVIGWFKKTTSREMVRICSRKRKKSPGVTCTYDHKVYMVDGTKKEAGQLKAGDCIKTFEKKREKSKSQRGSGRHSALSEDQMQVALGTVLGDGYLYPYNHLARLQWTHCKEQEEYLRWKLYIFGCEDKIKLQRGGFGNRIQRLGRTVGWAQLKFLCDEIYKDKKRISMEILERLKELGLAIWFMDDASFNKKKRYYTLYTNGYSYEENLIIQEFFRKKWNLKCSVLLDKKSNTFFISFPKNASAKIRLMISPYLIKSMEYKGYLSSVSKIEVSNQFLDYGLLIVDHVERDVQHYSKTKKGHRVYDITVEDNHNFVANGLIVSNCHEAAALQYRELLTFFKARKVTGLSATPEREDGLTGVIKAHIGPIVKVDDLGEMTTYVDKNETNFAYGFTGNYNLLLDALVEDWDRNELIINKIIQYADKSHCILVHSKRIKHIENLRDMLAVKRSDLITDVLVSEYKRKSYSNKEQVEIKERFRNKDVQILFGGPIIEQGFNVERASAVFLTLPTKSARLIKQLLGRVQRECKGKKGAFLIDFIDKREKVLLYQFYARIKLYKQYKKVSGPRLKGLYK